MAISVKLEVFEGPLDLLMHLIEKNKVDIYDIPIVEITDQYLEYIRAMDHEDMNVTSEFMLMAATLIDIKCRMLLPKETDENEEEIDPREELVHQLLEYKKYKYMSAKLREQMDQAGDSVFRIQNLPEEVKQYREPVDPEALLQDMTLSKLHEIFQSVLRRQESRVDPVRSSFSRVERETVSLPDQMTYVETFAVRKRKFSFRKLLEGQKSRTRLVITFLAVLELMKLGKIYISQEELFGDISIESLEPENTIVTPYTEEAEEI